MVRARGWEAVVCVCVGGYKHLQRRIELPLLAAQLDDRREAAAARAAAAAAMCTIGADAADAAAAAAHAAAVDGGVLRLLTCREHLLQCGHRVAQVARRDGRLDERDVGAAGGADADPAHEGAHLKGLWQHRS